MCPLRPDCKLRRHTDGFQQRTGPTVQISLPFVAIPNGDLQVLLLLASGFGPKDCPLA
ncbi:hypothetical protein DICSQDRAFT_140460 [Dichomitus squalens LYAD-421 SS1]|uniref:Uncharacterized protein n=1 Tax=Dichomitus squalens (strain LYAD-421) TaxID=732165 RepID=R7SNK7_DICSQ|nr:uncharacterized protein DICSQDRAFT_140460 [Dichomitus squalens LYAD-421 SS1]EJF57305.1 hypothetical protein DICSQDRAFT_140460 [Dichomitus squalens LYAD-421 SS1]